MRVHHKAGRSPTSEAFAVLIGILLAVITSTIFLFLFRFMIEWEPSGRVMVRGFGLVGWGPYWTHVWTVILLVVSVVSVSLALRHVIHDGGLLGTTGLLVSVPVGTSLYREFVTRYPDISGAALEGSDVTVYYPIGYNLFSSQQPHWMDVVVLVGLLGAVFLLGRWIATSKRHTRDRLVVSVLFLGTILYWYLDPIPFRRDMYMAPSPYMMQFVGEGIWYATIMAVGGWLMLSLIRFVNQREPIPVSHT